MTEKTLVECNGQWCEPTGTHYGSSENLPDEWNEVTAHSGTTLHFCPTCSYRMTEWGMNGRSTGEEFAVQHNYVGEDFEEAHISPGVNRSEEHGTHSMTVEQLIDEPPRQFPNYDHETDEAWHFHVYDHLGLTIIGPHKDNPRVILEPEEFPTTFEIREADSGYSFDEIAVEKSIDVRWLD